MVLSSRKLSFIYIFCPRFLFLFKFLLFHGQKRPQSKNSKVVVKNTFLSFGDHLSEKKIMGVLPAWQVAHK